MKHKIFEENFRAEMLDIIKQYITSSKDDRSIKDHATEVLDTYIKNTIQHIDLVKECGGILMEKVIELQEDAERFKINLEFHDHDKLNDPNIIPIYAIGCYVLYFNNGELPFEYQKGIETAFEETAWPRHYKNNQHHVAEHFGSKENGVWVIKHQAPALAVTEMIADWMAMGITHGDSANAWWNKTKDKKWKFDPASMELIETLLKVEEESQNQLNWIKRFKLSSINAFANISPIEGSSPEDINNDTYSEQNPIENKGVNEDKEASTEKYDPPYTADEMLKKGYSKDIVEKLKSDPVHKWRMDTGIELIHREPTKRELKRIWKNWNKMTKEQQTTSDKKCKELFGCTNEELYNYLLPQYKVERPNKDDIKYPSKNEASNESIVLQRDSLYIGPIDPLSLDFEKMGELLKHQPLLDALKSWTTAPNHDLIHALKELGRIVDEIYDFKKDIVCYRGIRTGLSLKPTQNLMGVLDDVELMNLVKPGYKQGSKFKFNTPGPMSVARSPWIAKIYGDFIVKCVLTPKISKLVITNELAYLLQQMDRTDSEERAVNLSVRLECIVFPGEEVEFEVVSTYGDISSEVPELAEGSLEGFMKDPYDSKNDEDDPEWHNHGSWWEDLKRAFVGRSEYNNIFEDLVKTQRGTVMFKQALNNALKQYNAVCKQNVNRILTTVCLWLAHNSGDKVANIPNAKRQAISIGESVHTVFDESKLYFKRGRVTLAAAGVKERIMLLRSRRNKIVKIFELVNKKCTETIKHCQVAKTGTTSDSIGKSYVQAAKDIIDARITQLTKQMTQFAKIKDVIVSEYDKEINTLKDQSKEKIGTEALLPFINTNVYKQITDLAKLCYKPIGQNSWEHIQQVYSQASRICKKLFNRTLTPVEYAACLFHDCSVIDSDKKNHNQLSADKAVSILKDLFTPEELNIIHTAIVEHDNQVITGQWKFSSLASELVAAGDFNPPDAEWIMNKSYTWGISHGFDHEGRIVNMVALIKRAYSSNGEMWLHMPNAYKNYFASKINAVKKLFDKITPEEAEKMVMDYRKKHHLSDTDINLPTSSVEMLKFHRNVANTSVADLIESDLSDESLNPFDDTVLSTLDDLAVDDNECSYELFRSRDITSDYGKIIKIFKTSQGSTYLFTSRNKAKRCKKSGTVDPWLVTMFIDNMTTEDLEHSNFMKLLRKRYFDADCTKRNPIGFKIVNDYLVLFTCSIDKSGSKRIEKLSDYVKFHNIDTIGNVDASEIEKIHVTKIPKVGTVPLQWRHRAKWFFKGDTDKLMYTLDLMHFGHPITEVESVTNDTLKKYVESDESLSYETITAKVEQNIVDGKVYHASPFKLDKLSGNATKKWSGETGSVFVSPCKGLMPCFCINKDDVLKAAQEQLGGRLISVNFGYDVWNWSIDKLRTLPSKVTILLNVRGLKPFTGESTGYLYTIDYEKYKDKTHMFNKNMDSDVEFLIKGDVDYIKCEKLTVKWECRSSEECIKRHGEAELVPDSKKITFPPSEIETLKKQDKIITTRVSKDFETFKKDDIVETPWGDTFKVTSREVISKIEDHPFYKELTAQQISYLKKFDKIAVLTLVKQKDSSKKASSTEDLSTKEYVESEAISIPTYKAMYNKQQIVSIVNRIGQNPVGNNCQRHAIAFVLAVRNNEYRRFEDVTSPFDIVFDTIINKPFEFKNWFISKSAELQNIQSLFDRQDPFIAIVSVKWKKGNGGHVFNAIRIDNETYVVDCQEKKIELASTSSKYLNKNEIDYNKSFVLDMTHAVLDRGLIDISFGLSNRKFFLNDNGPYASIIEGLAKLDTANTTYTVSMNNTVIGQIRCDTRTNENYNFIDCNSPENRVYYVYQYHWVSCNIPSSEALSDKEKRTYYILSQTDAAYLNLVPRIPDNEFVDWGAEDNTTKRVCLAPSITKCILAIGRLKPNQELTVYSIELSDSDLIRPTKQQVPDVHITNEIWVTHPIQVVRRMKIRIKDSYKKEYELTFEKADGTTYTGHPREYEYQIIDNISSSEALSPNISKKKAAIIKYICDVCDILDPSKTNSKRYHRILDHMSDQEFDQWMNYVKEGKWQIHIVAPNMIVNLRNENILKAADKVGCKLFHRLWIEDPTTGRKYLTDNEYLILNLPVRRQQQFLDEKMSVPENDRKIDGLTGQVTGDSRACSVTNPEIQILAARGLDATLEEFVNVRGGNMHAYAEFRRQAEETGEITLNTLDPNTRSRVAVVGQVLVNSMMLDTNIVE